MPASPVILLTAFEPSGDILGASLVKALRRRQPDIRFKALGGPRLQEAGCEIIEQTTDDPAMLLDAARKVVDHRRRIQRLRAYLEQNPVDAVIPIDSPAANWDVCQATRDLLPDARIIHLVAPQLWAWGRWRVNKLRRLTDRVLCLLPFEPDWFQARDVPATFVGHPLFDRINDDPPTPHDCLSKPAGKRLALLPGSRSAEVAFNWETMTRVARTLHQQFPDLHVVIPASDERREKQIRQHPATASLDHCADIIVGHADAVYDWADAALIVSGTATLEALGHSTPTVVLYNVRYLTWLFIGRFLTTTRTYSLPNLISEWLGEGRVVPEFIPHFGRPEPVADAVRNLLTNPEAVAQQRQLYTRVHEAFGNQRFKDLAADAVLQAIAS
ncbi:lipid-A-disaccharide synthase [Mucisphaera calidilacus]|uniref:Lipid-A-disaccharide synthase n=1 Tax=Mucisphaera calidilacus TaxID=2527982 RepID=A0A518BUX0_9BACT|nr:lipid-A-disaccharide synthase [Mucisphaera calidilacus]QDU70778.1 Glycosyl transferase [Mucisphaera calidilacus]